MHRMPPMLFCIPVVLAGCTAQSSLRKSSAVPERREFPVSTTIDPCTDFFEYACSEVNDTFELRDDRSRHIYSFHDSNERLLEARKNYLARLETATNLSPRGVQIRDYYLACINDPARGSAERAEVTRIRKVLSSIETRTALQTLLGGHVLTPEFSVLTFGLNANPDDSDRWDVYLAAGSLMSLPERSYYENPEVLGGFLTLVEQFFTEVGFDRPADRARWVIEFEQNFASIYPRPAEWRELYVHKEWISRSDLLERYPNLALGPFVAAMPQGVEIRHFTSVYFDFLNQAMAGMDIDAIKSVYAYHALADALDVAYPKFFKAKFDFEHRWLGGPPARSSRVEECTAEVAGRLGRELDAELVDVVFPDFDRARFETLVDRVRQAMIARLEGNTWLSDTGRAAAIRKMQATSMMLVQPTTEADWDFNLPATYDPIEPLNNRRINRAGRMRKSMERVGLPRNKNLWGMGPLTINAYYSPPNNQFVMPIGILQYPFYDPNLPDHVNYGAVGAVVGHELGHAIDDKGSRFDENGEINQWMTAGDLAAFKDRTARINTQFEEVCYDDAGGEVCHNGQLTMGENIGDLTGVSFALAAAPFSDDPATARQQKREFFLQYARVWCGTMRDQERNRRLKTDPHALPDARVNQIIVHHEPFYEAYGCDADDAMYLPPNERVAPW